MAELYAKVANSYYKPNQAELSNLEAMDNRFNNGKNEFKKVKDKHLPKVIGATSKDAMKPLVLKTFEEFKREP